MPPRSTARHISYDVRPSKQIERKILVELLRLASDVGLPIRDYKYVGLGANRFYDFIMMHRDLAIVDMVSLEHDPKMYERAQYNCPFKFIDVRKKKTSQFLAQDDRTSPEVLWLDYDGALSRETIQDIRLAADRFATGDFLFVTVYGAPPQWATNLSPAERKSGLEERFGALASVVDTNELDDASFAVSTLKLLAAVFTNAFSQRTDGVFQRILNVSYADSVPMVTYGGALLAKGTAQTYLAQVRSAMPFLRPGGTQPFRVPAFTYTDRERLLLDRVATTPTKRNSKERNLLSKFGFGKSDIDSYAELIRFIPRYVESAF